VIALYTFPDPTAHYELCMCGFHKHLIAQSHGASNRGRKRLEIKDFLIFRGKTGGKILGRQSALSTIVASTDGEKKASRFTGWL
jgi:hypothetical protein